MMRLFATGNPFDIGTMMVILRKGILSRICHVTQSGWVSELITLIRVTAVAGQWNMEKVVTFQEGVHPPGSSSVTQSE